MRRSVSRNLNVCLGRKMYRGLFLATSMKLIPSTPRG
jgi:hypothetical protein